MAIRGDACKLYYSAADVLDAGTNANAVLDWTVIDLVTDLTLDLTKDEIDVTTRGASGWEQTLEGFKKGSISFDMVWDNTNTAFQVLLDAFIANPGTKVAMNVLDGAEDTTGSEGLASNMSITGFSRSEPVNGAVTATVTVKPYSFTEWAVMT